jgi:hypothetical protein
MKLLNILFKRIPRSHKKEQMEKIKNDKAISVDAPVMLADRPTSDPAMLLLCGITVTKHLVVVVIVSDGSRACLTSLHAATLPSLFPSPLASLGLLALQAVISRPFPMASMLCFVVQIAVDRGLVREFLSTHISPER